MRNHIRRIQRAAFGMGMLAAMAFGAVQATAAPARATSAERNCTTMQQQYCRDYCGQWDASCRNGICTCF